MKALKDGRVATARSLGVCSSGARPLIAIAKRSTSGRRPERSKLQISPTRSGGEEAQRRQELFSKIVPIYDTVNEIMSLGQHKEWKRRCVQYAGARRGSHVLDICCGSGDLTQLLSQRVGPEGKVAGLDFSPAMLARAKERKTPDGGCQIEWLEGDALQLPFEDQSFDAATMGYGLRNVTDIAAALREIRRILRPGSRISILDFNASANSAVDSFQEMALQYAVVPVASVFGMAEEYRYIRESIKHFPKGPELEALASSAGFQRAQHYEFAAGLMGILVAQR